MLHPRDLLTRCVEWFLPPRPSRRCRRPDAAGTRIAAAECLEDRALLSGVAQAMPFDSLIGLQVSNGHWVAAQSNGSMFANELAGVWSPGITWVDINTGDVNGDGHLDVVGRQQDNGNWWVGVNDGTGQFTNQQWGHWSPVGWVDVHLADVNGDGNVDLVGRQENDGRWWVGLSDGAGSFTNQNWGFWNSVPWLDVQTADVNGDGNFDVVGRQQNNGNWWVALSDGAGSFTNQLWGNWQPVSTWAHVMVADVNNDSRDDVVGLINERWWVALSDGTSFTNQIWGTGWTGAWTDVNVADVNGDGSGDIVGRALPATGPVSYRSGGGWRVALSDGVGAFTSSA